MANKEVHIGDDWYLDENNDGDLIFYNSRKNEVVKAIDVITGAEDKKGNSVDNQFPPHTILAYGADYGIKPFTNSNDFAQAFIDAVNYLLPEGGILQLSSGIHPWKTQINYSTDSSLLNINQSNKSANIIVKGAGAVRRHASGQNNDEIENTVLDVSYLSDTEAALTASSDNLNLSLRDLAIYGGRQGDTYANNPNGIEFWENLHLYRVEIYYCNIGIKQVANSDGLIGMTWDRVIASESYQGINTVNGGKTTTSDLQIRVRRCTGEPAAHLGWTRSSNLKTYIESNDQDGLYIDKLDDAQIIRGHYENNAKISSSKAPDLWIKEGKALTLGPGIVFRSSNYGTWHVILGDSSGGTPVDNSLIMPNKYDTPVAGSLKWENGIRNQIFIGRMDGDLDISAGDRFVVYNAEAIGGSKLLSTDSIELNAANLNLHGATVDLDGGDLTWANFPQLFGDPAAGDFGGQEKAIFYVSDGSGDCTGEAGDLILAINHGGTVKTKIVGDFTAM